MKIFIYVVIALFLNAFSVLAQVNSPVNFEAGFQVGQLLPNQIQNVTEIMSLGGLRLGFPLGPNGFIEGGVIGGAGYGVGWKNLHLSLRMDVPVEQLVGFVYLGADAVYVDTEVASPIFYGGGHVGGGVMSLIADSLWFRGDMKFNVTPGTSMFLGFGLVLRL